MEHFEERWQAVIDIISERFGKKPNMEALLFLIGIQEIGQLPSRNFTKEQKQDLMHVAVCTLLSHNGYFKLTGRDSDGWPHFQAQENVPKMTVGEQEKMLQEEAILYFEKQGVI